MNSAPRSMTIVSPNGHIGTAPLRPDSFARAVAERPDAIIADSGSCDIGPAPLALDISSSDLAWQRGDLEKMLLAARELRVPMIIGSAGDTGADSRVDLYVKLIQEIAREHSLTRFNLGYFYSEVQVEQLRDRVRSGAAVAGLGGRPGLTDADLDATDHAVAVAGIHPFMKLLDDGADVIIAGRCSDVAIFAAPAIRAGYAEGLSYHLGKLLECASFCAEPYGAKDSVLGTITDDQIRVAAMNPEQRCTVASVSAHSMYERPNPFFEYVLGGRLDMRGCTYEQYDERTCAVSGATFAKADPLTVKIEGAGRLGERYIGFAGIRDPYTIQNLKEVTDWSRAQVRELFPDSPYNLYFHAYGADAVMGEWEPTREPGHEVGILVEVVAPTAATAEKICLTATKQLFYAHLPEVKGSAGSVAYLFDEVLPAKPACAWTINHTIEVNDPLEMFRLRMTEAGV